MVDQKLSNTDLEILQQVLYEGKTLSEIAQSLRTSLPAISNHVKHLASMNLIDIQKKGKYKSIKISSSPIGESLFLVMTESSYLNLKRILTGSGLLILPLLLKPGSKTEEISKKISRSVRTVKNTISRLREMGIVILDKNNHNYMLNYNQKYLTQFIEIYSEFKNKTLLREFYHDAVIVWQWRDEFMFSIPYQIDNPRFITAGVSRLDELGYKLFHTINYYFKSPELKGVSKEEAFAQALYIDQKNPRIVRLVNEAIRDNKVDRDKFKYYSEKYKIQGTSNL
jgi:predicted transcriptional regulator